MLPALAKFAVRRTEPPEQKVVEPVAVIDAVGVGLIAISNPLSAPLAAGLVLTTLIL